MRTSVRYGLIPLLLLFVVSLFLSIPVGAQVVFRQPPPGSVYREYSQNMGGLKDWRITDPNIDLNRWPDAAPFLPNPVLHIDVNDLDGAVRAEAVIAMWGGHWGTFNKQIRFNGNSWLNLPPLDPSNGIPSGDHGEEYMSEPMVGIDVPLAHLHAGDNTFEGTNAGQLANPSTGWGQFGWYGIILRIYYGPGKSHPTGSITSPSSGASFGENPSITASVSGGVNRVEFLAYYDGFDTDGDGIYQEYHSDYHDAQDAAVSIRNLAGVATSAPFTATWNTDWIPDQAAGGVKLVARIRDNNGMWYVTDEVTNLTLSRPNSSVKMYKPQNVPSMFWVKQYMESKSCTFTIPQADDLSKATAALFIIRSWNGLNGQASPPNDALSVKVNDWTAPTFGNDHYYSLDAISLSPSELKKGTNTFTAYCNSVHHGLEVLWPGPAVMVRYSGAASPEPPHITQQPANQSAAVGETATFTVQATGSATLEYQWQKNGANIGTNANGASYTTPAVQKSDSGAAFRCIVTNGQGADTSHVAYLLVTSTAAKITQHPQNQSVGVGETATFTVTATGTPAPAYQWQKNGANIGTNANSASYTTPAVQKSDSGATFRCIVSNSGGADTSHPALLIVGTFPPNITQEPSPATVRVGRPASFTVVATGTAPLAYQWQKNGAAIDSATAATYTTPPTTTLDSGAVFRCIVSNDAGRDTSISVVLNVTSGVANLVVNGGFEAGTSPWWFFTNGNGQFTTDAAGPTSAHAAHVTLTQEGSNVQLYQINIALEADTNYTLRFKARSSTGHDVAVSVQRHTSPYTTYGLSGQVFDLTDTWGTFTTQFKATGFTGTTSDVRLLFWLAPYDANGDEYFFDDVILAPTSMMIPPGIATHPHAASAHAGETAGFSVVASGPGPFTYQWQKNSTNIEGATSASYTTPVLTMADNGAQFRCVVSNFAGDATSDAATLTVSPVEGIAGNDMVPDHYFLAQNHPNPFNPSTIIRFGLPTAGPVTVRVMNLLGQEVRTLVSGAMSAGIHEVVFSADGLASGIYLYRMQSGTFTQTRKLILLR